MIPLTEIFCHIDDFCTYFDEQSQSYLLPNPNRKRNRLCTLSLSEIMTIVVMFQLSHYRTFKDFYLNCILIQYRKEFPNYVSYNRFIELIPLTLMPLVCMLLVLPGKETGKYFIDSTKIPVCHNLRIHNHKVFKEFAARGKTSTGWFFGFKLHLIVNNQGELMSFMLSPGNVDDRKPVQKMVEKLKGWLMADRGYISKKQEKQLEQQGLELITRVKKNMKQRIIDPAKEYFLDKRGMIETIIDQLKNIFHISHTRHRSVINAQVNSFAALLAYVFKPKKISVKFHELPAAKCPLMSN